jgi:hypothetical protein
MADAWGQLSFGIGNFGEQNNSTPLPTGLLATLSSGNPTISSEINRGWGRQEWDSLAWGIGGNVLTDSQQLTTNTGQVTIDAEINTGWGRQGWNTRAWGIGGEVLPDSQQLSTSIGTVFADAEVNLGWGRLDGWGTRMWGNAAQAITAADFSLSTSIGSVTIDSEINSGWGRITWGDNGWGIQGTLQTTEFQLNTSIGTVEVDAKVQEGWGREEGWGTRAWGAPQQIVTLTGFGLNSNIGSVTVTAEINVGWGRVEWGNWAWGVAYSVIPEGQQLTSAMGEEAAGTDFVAEVTGQQLQSEITPVGTSANSDHEIAHSFLMTTSIGDTTEVGTATVDLTGIDLTLTQGITVGGTKTPVDVTGSQLDLTLGNFNLVQSTVESVTGLEITSSIGNQGPIPQNMVGAQGQELTSSVGSVGPITGTANVQLTGIVLTSSVGQLNINAWAEIDPDVNNIWTEVDLAA